MRIYLVIDNHPRRFHLTLSPPSTHLCISFRYFLRLMRRRSKRGAGYCCEVSGEAVRRWFDLLLSELDDTQGAK